MGSPYDEAGATIRPAARRGPIGCVPTAHHGPIDCAPTAQRDPIDCVPAVRRGPIGCVMVCLDGSSISEACLPWAMSLAGGFRSRLLLVRVLEAPAAGLADAVDWQIAKSQAEQDLARRRATVTGVARVDALLLQGHPAEQLLCAPPRAGGDLAGLARQGEHGVTEGGLASTAEKVLDRLPCSVLVVPAGAPPVQEKSPARALVLLDGSPRAESVLPPLERLARERGTTLVLLHVVPPADLLPAAPPCAEDAELARSLDRRNERVAREYLARLGSRLEREGLSVRQIVERGDLRSALPAVAARERADLVALTAHGRTGNPRACLGATASHVVHHLVLPTLVVQDLPQPRSEFARSVLHRREALPLRGGERLGAT